MDRRTDVLMLLTDEHTATRCRDLFACHETRGAGADDDDVVHCSQIIPARAACDPSVATGFDPIAPAP